MPRSPDYYQVLGISRRATDADVRRAYRDLARTLHPDTNKDPAAEARFRAVTEAYEVLKDPERRAHFDQFGFDAKNTPIGESPAGRRAANGPSSYASTPDDLNAAFESIFNGFSGFGTMGGARAANTSRKSGPRTRRTAKTPPPTPPQPDATLTISLREAALGTTRALTASASSSAASPRREITLTIPPGTRPGTLLRMAGALSSRADAPPQDLLVKVEVAPDPRFRLENGHLTGELLLAPWEAALGASVEVETFSGPVTVKVPAGSSSGQRLRLKGRGFPDRPSGTPGDLFLELRIVVPKNLSEREAQAYQALADASNFFPRST
jgi:curved DNA-binding protein